MPMYPANVINDDVFTKSVIEQAKDVLGDFGDLRHKRLLLHACSKDEFADRVEAGQGTKVSSSLDLSTASGAVMAPLVSGLKPPYFSQPAVSCVQLFSRYFQSISSKCKS